VERYGARVALGDRVLETFAAQQQRQRGEAKTLPRSRRAVAGQRLARGTKWHLLSRMQSTPNRKLRDAPKAARMTNRVLLGSVNARLAPPLPLQFPKYRASMAKTCCGPQRGRSRWLMLWVKVLMR
jgi:hypothetical protein